MAAPTRSDEATLAMLRRHNVNPSGFLALNAGNQYFTERGIDGFVAYRPAGRCWVQFGGPVTAPQARAELLGAFIDRARHLRRRIIGVQLLREDAELQSRYGFHANQFGTSFSIRLADFTLRGQRFVKTRNMISRATREGVVTHEVGRAGEPAAPPGLDEQLADIDRLWLRGKGRLVKELRFFVGERTGPYQRLRRMFLATRQGRVEAYVTFSPVYGPASGWLYDLTRRRPDGTKGCIEQVFAAAAQRMAADGDGWLHLGLTPFVGLSAEHELDSAHRSAGRSIRLLADHGKALYPADSQMSFKRKWHPQLETPEYLTFPGRLRLTDVWRLMKVANLA